MANTMNDDFYGSIDRLVEFGLSGRLAHSMIQTMNDAMATMQLPDYGKNNKIDMTNNVAVTPISQKRFFVAGEEGAEGPFDKDELQQLMSSHKVNGNTLIWYNGLPGWVEAGKLEEISLMYGQVPPTMQNV